MFGDVDPGWYWLIGGVLLLIAEIIAPGFFLVWIGIAAMLTGVFTVLFDIGVAGQLALFALYAVLAVLVARRWYTSRLVPSEDPLLNDRSAQLIGRQVRAISDISGHSGRVRLGDSEWSARGGPAAAGEQVRITGVEGNCLIVEADRQLP
jgi:membrane protein implicated in regulation of membrane protease activity